jgi:RNA polymerase sigma-70 factor (ECF subfamily)
MSAVDPSSIQTRPSLLQRLQAGNNTDAWQEFYRVYGKLVHDFAIRAGLRDTEAEEVVQEIAIGVARNLPEFRYDPKVCRFKTWLLNQASWRIKNQLRRRARHPSAPIANSQPSGDPGSSLTGAADPVAGLIDGHVPNLDALFEVEWRVQMTTKALERVKAQFTLKQFQIFDLTVQKEWTGPDVARALDVSLANVYVTRHRIAAALKREVRKLESAMESNLERS